MNIGAVMEYGATIQHPNGAVIVIPPRPFLHPTMEKYREADHRELPPGHPRCALIPADTSRPAPVGIQRKRSLEPEEPELETVRTVVENPIRLIKAEIDPDAVLVAADDVFEVPNVPSLILQGPTLVGKRRPPHHGPHSGEGCPEPAYEQCRHPRLYHLDFDVIVTAGHEGDLLDLPGTGGPFLPAPPDPGRGRPRLPQPDGDRSLGRIATSEPVATCARAAAGAGSRTARFTTASSKRARSSKTAGPSSGRRPRRIGCIPHETRRNHCDRDQESSVPTCSRSTSRESGRGLHLNPRERRNAGRGRHFRRDRCRGKAGLRVADAGDADRLRTRDAAGRAGRDRDGEHRRIRRQASETEVTHGHISFTGHLYPRSRLQFLRQADIHLLLRHGGRGRTRPDQQARARSRAGSSSSTNSAPTCRPDTSPTPQGRSSTTAAPVLYVNRIAHLTDPDGSNSLTALKAQAVLKDRRSAAASLVTGTVGTDRIAWRAIQPEPLSNAVSDRPRRCGNTTRRSPSASWSRQSPSTWRPTARAIRYPAADQVVAAVVGSPEASALVTAETQDAGIVRPQPAANLSGVTWTRHGHAQGAGGG
ncbi:MAG: hypothetical protein MZV70_52060 [Desulfobacterales bacterium]|nr:hypothetical protein [Desulfobacterales bacterium]